MKASLALILLVTAFFAGPIRADSDQDRALAAVRSGQVLPLKTILERLERPYPGRVLEVELEREDGRWIYEIKLLRMDGQLVKLEVDAGTGNVIKHRARHRRN